MLATLAGSSRALGRVAVQPKCLADYDHRHQRDPESELRSSHSHEVASNPRGEALVAQSRKLVYLSCQESQLESAF